METWTDLEGRFRAIEDLLRNCVLEYHFDDKGWEHYELWGGPAPACRSLEALAEIAGKKLLAEGRLAEDTIYHSDAPARVVWWRALWRMAGPHREPAIATERIGDRLLRTITLAQIAAPAAFSAALALQFQSVDYNASLPRSSLVVSWLEGEKQKRGILWTVIAALLAILLAALAI